MTVLLILAFGLVALAGTAVATRREPAGQAVTYSVFGLALTILFLVLQAPDVALSQLAIGSAVVPLMVMLTVREMRRVERADSTERDDEGGSE